MSTTHSVGRNDPCHCGSGKKYKKCCMTDDEALARQLAAEKSSRPAPLPGFAPSPGAHVMNRFEKQNHEPPSARGLPDALLEDLEERWNAFDELETRDEAAMDALLTDLLEFPAEANEWNNVFQDFARFGHPDLPSVFRRIAAAVPHTRETDMGFFYWAAAEQFCVRRERDLFPEVAAGIRKLDAESYDLDAVMAVATYLLIEDFEAEALEVAEHILPFVCADQKKLPPGAVSEHYLLTFLLRAGLALREKPRPDRPPGEWAADLLRDLEPEIHPDMARQAAAVLSGQHPAPDWTRAHFDLESGDIARSNKAWDERVRLATNLLFVAQEGWEEEQYPPAYALQGLHLLLSGPSRWSRNALPKKGRTSSAQNLLDFLRPEMLTDVLVQSCNEIFGLNRPRTHMVLEACEVLLHFAQRHAIISESDAATAQSELDRWHDRLAGKR